MSIIYLICLKYNCDRENLNPGANEFLRNIASGQTIADREIARNLTNLSKREHIYSKLLNLSSQAILAL